MIVFHDEGENTKPPFMQSASNSISPAQDSTIPPPPSTRSGIFSNDSQRKEHEDAGQRLSSYLPSDHPQSTAPNQMHSIPRSSLFDLIFDSIGKPLSAFLIPLKTLAQIRNIFLSAIMIIVAYLVYMLLTEGLYSVIVLLFGGFVPSSLSAFFVGVNSAIHSGLAFVQLNGSSYFILAPPSHSHSSEILSEFISSIREATSSNIGISLKEVASNARHALVIVEHQAMLTKGLELDSDDHNILQKTKQLAHILNDAIADSYEVVRESRDMFGGFEQAIDHIVKAFLEGNMQSLVRLLNDMDERILVTGQRILHVQRKYKDAHLLAEGLGGLITVDMAGQIQRLREKEGKAIHPVTIALTSIAAGLVSFAAQGAMLSLAPPVGITMAGACASSAGAWLMAMQAGTQMELESMASDVRLLQSMGLTLHNVAQSVVSFNTTLTRLRHELKQCGKHARDVKQHAVTSMERAFAQKVKEAKIAFGRARESFGHALETWFDDNKQEGASLEGPEKHRSMN